MKRRRDGDPPPFDGLPPAPRELSDEQRAAACRDANRVISASAGTGKTTTLTGIYLGLLSGEIPAGDRRGGGGPGLHPAQIVAVTFTEKAAAELLQRIGEKLNERSRREPPASLLAAHLKKCWEELPGAPIGTIHGFCARLLRLAGARGDLPVGFRMVEREETDEILETALGETAADRLAAGGDDALRGLAREWTVLGTGGLVQTARRLQDELCRRGEPPAVLAGKTDETRLVQTLQRDLESILADLRTQASKMRKGVDRDRLLEATHTTLSLRNCEEGHGFLLGLLDLCCTKSGDFRAGIKCTDVSRRLLEALHLAHAPYRSALARYLQAARERFQREKRRLGVLDFDDLLLEARDLLREQPKLGQGYAFVLIDEFQDTDPLQKEILFRLAFPPDGEPGGKPVRLAIVGDVKQSIYRFRGADVSLMRETCGSGHLAVDHLRSNYRSRRAVLKWVNSLCQTTLWPPSPDAKDISYDPAQHLRPAEDAGREHWDGPAGEWLVPSEGAEWPAMATHRGRQALAIARRIATLVTPEPPAGLVHPSVWDKDEDKDKKGGHLRERLRYRDIAILLRSLKHMRAPLELALARLGIPFQMLGGVSFFTRQEVLDGINLLAWVADPSDSAARLGFWRSLFVQLSDEALFRLAQGDAWESGAALEERDRAAFEAGRALVARLRRGLGRLTAAEMLDLAFTETGFLGVLALRPQGAVAVAAARRLIELARAFEARGATALADLVAWLRERAREEWEDPGGEGKPDLTPDLPEASDAVRIGTIHSAKGLEFNIVIVAELGFARSPSSPPAVYDSQAGLGLRLGREALGLPPRADSVHKRVTEEATRAEESESRRLLYVALTRARDYLILCGEPAKRMRDAETWRKWIAAHEEAARKNDLPSLERVPYDHPELKKARARSTEGVRRGKDGRPGFHLAAVAPALASALSAQAAGLRKLLEAGPRPPPRAGGEERREEISVTALARFLSCPRRFMLEQYAVPGKVGTDTILEGQNGICPHFPADESAETEQADEADPEARALGTAAHAALEAAFTSGQVEEAEGAWQASLAALGADPRGAGARACFQRVVRTLAGPWAQSVLALPPARRLAERPFQWQVTVSGGHVTLTGILDLLVQSGNGRHSVVDYKLAGMKAMAADGPGREALVRYAWQVGLYAQAAAKLLGLPGEVVEPALLFLEDAPAPPVPLARLPLSPALPASIPEEGLRRALGTFLTARCAARASEFGDSMDVHAVPESPGALDAFPKEAWPLDGAARARERSRCAAEHCPFVKACFGA
jgi:ATP-dependent helicase/nuclease subunit A